MLRGVWDGEGSVTATELVPDDPVVLELRAICPRVRRVEEAGVVYYELPGLILGNGATPNRCDALLRLTGGDGYASRLFLAQQVAGPRPVNWNGNAFILQRKWFAFSWNVSKGVSPLQVLTAHMGALR